MAYYPGEDGGYGDPPEPTPPTPQPNGPQTPEEHRASSRELVRQTYRDIMGREPNENELETDTDHYIKYGGDSLRSSLRGRLGNTPGGASGAAGTAVGGTGRSAYPPFQPPPFDYPDFNTPTPFEGAPYEPLTAETFTADPGYDWRVKEGTRALENSAAAQGLLRTGGTLKDLMSWREGLASQEFGNVDARRFRDWGANLGLKAQNYERDWRGALTDYSLKYGKESDEYARALSTYGMNFDVNQGQFGNLLNLYNLSTRNLPGYTPVPLPSGTIP